MKDGVPGTPGRPGSGVPHFYPYSPVWKPPQGRILLQGRLGYVGQLCAKQRNRWVCVSTRQCRFQSLGGLYWVAEDKRPWEVNRLGFGYWFCGLGRKSQFAQLGQRGYSVGPLWALNEIRNIMCLCPSILTLFLQAIGTRRSREEEETGRLLVSHFDQARDGQSCQAGPSWVQKTCSTRRQEWRHFPWSLTEFQKYCNSF